MWLRYYGVSSENAHYFGMDDGGRETTEEPDRCQFVKLALAHRSVVQLVKKSDSGQPILRGFFDPYLQNVVTIDRMLTGIDRRLIAFCFLQLNSTSEQRHLGVAPHETLKKMGIPYQAHFLIVVPKSWNSLSMSSVYAILSIPP